MAELCQLCRRDALVWSHNGTKSIHRWEAGEGSCGCNPLPVCVNCQLDVVRDHGLLLLDADAFPSTTEAFLN